MRTSKVQFFISLCLSCSYLSFSNVICKWIIHHDAVLTSRDEESEDERAFDLTQENRPTSRTGMRARRLWETGKESLKYKTCIQKYRFDYLLNELTSWKSWRKDNTASRKSQQYWKSDRHIFVLNSRCHVTIPLSKWSVLRTIMLKLDLLSIIYHRNRRYFVLSRFWFQRDHQIIKDHGWEFAGAYPDEEAQIYDDTNKQTWSCISASSGRPSALLSRRIELSNIVGSSSADLFDTHFARSWKRWKRECQSDFFTIEDNTKVVRIDRIISSTNRNWELIPAHAEDKRQCQHTSKSKQWMHLLRSSIFPWRRYWYSGEKYCIDFDVRTRRRLELPWLGNAIFVQS